jgi:hypothetical protein
LTAGLFPLQEAGDARLAGRHRRLHGVGERFRQHRLRGMRRGHPQVVAADQKTVNDVVNRLAVAAGAGELQRRDSTAVREFRIRAGKKDAGDLRMA